MDEPKQPVEPRAPADSASGAALPPVEMKAPNEAAKEAVVPPSHDNINDAQQLGTRLLHARTLRKLSQDQVVQQLKIPLKWLVAIEDGRWHEFTNPAYIRSYLRHYAKLLEMNVDADINVLYPPRQDKEVVQPLAKMSRTNLDSSRTKVFKTWGMVFFLLLLLLVGVFAVYRLTAPDAPPTLANDSALPSGQPLTQPSQAENALPSVLPLSIEPMSQTLLVAPSTAGASVSLVGAAVAETTPSSQNSGNAPALIIKARAASWLQVKDGQDKDLLTYTVKADETFVFHVNKPFNVVVGNAEKVEALYDNKPLNLKKNLSPNGNARLLVR